MAATPPANAAAKDADSHSRDRSITGVCRKFIASWATSHFLHGRDVSILQYVGELLCW